MFGSYVYGFQRDFVFEERILWVHFAILGGVFLEGFVCAFFCFFWMGFLVSLVENVVYFAFLGVFGAHRFFGGGRKRGFSSTLLDLGFGDLAF